MKNTKIFRILALAVIFSLLIIAIPATPVSAATVDIHPSSGPVGTEVVVSGTGFTATTYYQIIFRNITTGFSQTVQFGYTESAGSILTSFYVPECPKTASAYYVQVTVGTTSVNTPFTLISYIEGLSKSSGYVGDQVTITKGTGFIASQTVTIYFSNVSVATTSTNSLGSFPSVTFTVPSSSRGSQTVKVQDASGNYDTITFTTKQSITIAPASGAVGDEVTISGTGFGASKTIIITFGNTQVGTATTDTSGNFSTSFLIPSQATGTYKIEASDGTYKDSKNFTISAGVSLSQTSGYIGEGITISGTGFGASKTIIITFGNTQVGTATTDTSGSFSTSFLIPSQATGTYKIEASDGTYKDSKNFTISAGVSLSQTSGYIGEGITISGTGFGASKPITITLANTQIGTATTDATGSFSGSFVIPSHATGTYQIRVNDGTNTIDLDFTVLISTSLNQTTGNVGTELTVSGTGFIGTVSIKYDNTEVAQANVSAGAFSATFNVPPSTGGNHTITVSDGTNIERLTFTMESTPPPTPQPLLPAMAGKVKAKAYFDWSDVTDPSGVTYTLQIATNADFTSVVLVKDGLTDSEYTLTEGEKLASTKKDAPYYWRVWAIDGAGNKSGWTKAEEFYVGFQWPEMKGWLLYVLIGVGGLLVFFLGFWLGRRTAFY